MRVSTAVGAVALFILAAACGGDDSSGGSSGGADGGVAPADAATSNDGTTTNDGGGNRDGGTTGDGSTSNDSGGTSDAGPTDPAPVIGGCQLFPNDNPWNTRIDDPVAYPVHPNASTYAANMHATAALHPSWGDYSTNKYGIPWQTVGAGQTKVPITFTFPAESDPGPYPFPLTIKLEAPSASHGIVLDTSTCSLYETSATTPSGTGFQAYSGAKFDLGSNALRRDGWVSTDAAGLPILPGLVRLAEVQAGAVNHAIRFTMNNTQSAYIHPAVHGSGLTGTQYPPMGLRLRLKASFSLSGFSGPALVILTAMKKYGVILADNGSNWYVSGDSDDGWTNLMGAINTAFGSVHGGDFEAVSSGAISTVGL